MSLLRVTLLAAAVVSVTFACDGGGEADAPDGGGGDDGVNADGATGGRSSNGGAWSGGSHVDGGAGGGGAGGLGGLGGETSATPCEGFGKQEFGVDMVGCKMAVPFEERDVCGSHWQVCSAAQWRAAVLGEAPAPTHHYWVNEALYYGGEDSGACLVTDNPEFVDVSQCEPSTLDDGETPTANPMRVCALTTPDPLGNECNWTGCGWENTANEYFGGCEGNITAGVLCCRSEPSDR